MNPVNENIVVAGATLQPQALWVFGIMLLVSWTWPVGVVRAEFLRARNLDYVRAARALGVRDRVIIVRHVLPNAMVATLTFLPFILNGSITTLTSLDFLGFGLPPGSASLGEILAQGKANLHAPWLGLTAFLVLAARETAAVDLHMREQRPQAVRKLCVHGREDAARVVGAFPDGQSALMLVAARLRHVAGTRWGTRRYLDMVHLRKPETQEVMAAS